MEGASRQRRNLHRPGVPNRPTPPEPRRNQPNARREVESDFPEELLAPIRIVDPHARINIREIRDRIPSFEPVDINVNVLQDLLEDSHALEITHNIVTDETKFHTGSYQTKGENLLRRLNKLVKEMWTHVPLTHLRVEHANVIVFIASITEMFCFVSFISRLEKTNVPCHIIDKLTDYMISIEQIRKYGHVELHSLAHILALRDDVVESLQNFYRVKIPMEARTKINPPRRIYDRYNPYDAEWLCGTIISGPHYMACAKYMCVSMIHQHTINNLRNEIIAAKLGIEVDKISHIRVPMPFRPKDARLLTEGLANQVFVHTKMDEEMHEQILEQETDQFHPLLNFTRLYVNLAKLQADIRNRKRSAADTMLRSDKNTCRACSLVVATLSSVESYLLIVHKVFSLFDDMEHGLYGVGFPKSITRAAAKVYLSATIDNCRNDEFIRKHIKTSLEELRAEACTVVRKYYTELEEKCERIYAERMDIDIDRDANTFCYDITQADFPDEIFLRSRQMIKCLYFEEAEIERLNVLLNTTKQCVFDWPVENKKIPPFSINILTGGIMAFYSNFKEGMTESLFGELFRTMLHIHERYTVEYRFGGQILSTVHTVIDTAECVPSVSEINQELATQMKTALGDKVIEEIDAAGFANTLAEIVHMEIGVCDFRSRYKNQLATAATAKRLVQMIVYNFLDFIKTQEEFLKDKAASRNKRNKVVQDIVLRRKLCLSKLSSSSSSSSTFNVTAHDFDVHMANMALLFQSLTIASDDEEEVCHRCPHVCHHCEEVPELVVNAFIANFVGVDLGPLGDAPHYNVPLD